MKNIRTEELRNRKTEEQKDIRAEGLKDRKFICSLVHKFFSPFTTF